MKKKLLLKTVLSALLVGGMILSPFEAKADTSVISNDVGGWIKCTSSLSTPLSDYYFVFVDKNEDLMLAFGEGLNQSSNDSYKTMVYRTSEDPVMNPSMLWTLSENDGGYSIKSAIESTYYIQTENNAAWNCRTHDNGGGSASWYKWNIALSDGAYRIENGKYTGNYVGPWDGAAFSNGREVAGNKTASGEVGYFYIYAILRSEVDLTGVTTATSSKPFNYTYKITNPYAAVNTHGWTMGGDTNRNAGTGFDNVKGFFEPSQWGWNSFDLEMSQTISGLPAGKYRLRAAVQSSADCTVTLKANANSSDAFTGSGTSNGTILQTGKETTEGSGVAGWKWRTLDFTDLTGSIKIAFNTKTNVTHNWANVDNVELYYLGPIEDQYELFQAALTTYAPYSDVPAANDATGYTTQYNTYANYTDQTSAADLLAAITYMQNNFANYQWANASIAHPVDVTEEIISGWECTSNDAWPGSGRTTATGTYYDGTSRTYFTQNHENGAARSQAVTIPETGAYLLRTIVRPVADASYATITIGSESTTTRGIQTGSANIGNNWAYNDIYFATTSANESKTISIALSNVNLSREADCGEMHLLYIGQSADFVKDGVHKYIGTFASAPAITLTDDVPVADIKGATFTSGSSTLTFTNPNGLVFANAAAQVSSTTKNVVVNGTCGSLQLEKDHPFINPTEFTATAAKYAMVAGELAGGSFATLMIPFTASSLPSGGSAYILDQGVNLIDGNVYGTASSIAANTPVLVTAGGNYTGSNVTVPVVASGATYTSGELVGTYTAMAAPTSSYVLQNHTSGEGVAFYLVGSTQPTVNPFRAYIKSQGSSVKAFKVLFGDADGIGATQMNNEELIMNNSEIFNLAGQRLTKPVKGINIVNGKKVIVK